MSDEPNAAKLFLAALADRIRDWREALEVSRETVAKRSGLSVSTIRRIEAGTGDPKITTLWALAKAMEAELYEIVDVSGEELGIAADGMLKTG
jgi:transcriptional regulator with XRE-family HTH domain